MSHKYELEASTVWITSEVRHEELLRRENLAYQTPSRSGLPLDTHQRKSENARNDFTGYSN